jgi:hypothetical protein
VWGGGGGGHIEELLDIYANSKKLAKIDSRLHQPINQFYSQKVLDFNLYTWSPNKLEIIVYFGNLMKILRLIGKLIRPFFLIKAYDV